MAVHAGAEHGVVGPEVRVTIWGLAVVVGQVSQTTVDALEAAREVKAWITADGVS